jgi:proline iminopeptidase
VYRDQKSGFVRISGHRIYYETYGFGERGTIIVVPGGPGLGHEYLHSLADLAPLGYCVVFYDPLGCGRSERPRRVSSCTFEKSIEEVEGIRRAVCPKSRIHLLGHSHGAAVALEAALRKPGHLGSLLLSSPAVPLPEAERIWKQSYAGLPREARAFMARKNARLEDIWEPGSKGGYRRYHAGYDLFVRLRICRMNVPPYDLVHSMQNGDPRTFQAIVRTRTAYYAISSLEDSARRYGKLSVPCLITVGRYDQIPPRWARALQRRIPGSRLVTFKHSSHSAQWEERERYIETLDRFLRRSG